MKISEIMIRDVISIRDNMLVSDANDLMFNHKISGLPVIDESGKVIGILTQDDLIRALLPSYQEIHEDERLLHDYEYMESRAHTLAKTPVRDIMSKEVYTVDEDTPVVKAASLMFMKKIKRIPVMREGKLVGVVSRTDIINAIFK